MVIVFLPLLVLEVSDRPVSISFLSNLGKTRKKPTIAWSSGGRYLASCITIAPAVIWVWSTAQSFTLCCAIVTKYPVQGKKEHFPLSISCLVLFRLKKNLPLQIFAGIQYVTSWQWSMARIVLFYGMQIKQFYPACPHVHL